MKSWKVSLVGGIVAAAVVSAQPAMAQSFPFPFPGGNGGSISIPIPLPGGNRGSFPFPIPGNNGGLSLPIPLPGGNGGTIAIPIPMPGGNGGYFPSDRGGYYPDNRGGYYPPDSGYRRGYPPVASRMPFPFPFPGNGNGQPDWQEEDDHHDEAPLPGQPVAGYSAITVKGLPARVDSRDLPVRVYSVDPRYNGVTARSIQIWNDAGQQLGGLRFFEQVNTPDQANFNITWDGSTVPRGAAGVTGMKVSSRAVLVTGVAIKSQLYNNEQSLTEVLAHELGHTLGLDHSKVGSDLMYHRKRSNNPTGEVAMSPRDLQMLGWLYSQQNAVAIVPPRRVAYR